MKKKNVNIREATGILIAAKELSVSHLYATMHFSKETKL